MYIRSSCINICKKEVEKWNISSYLLASMKTPPFRYFIAKQHCMVCSWCSFTSCNPRSVDHWTCSLKICIEYPIFNCPIRLQHLRRLLQSQKSQMKNLLSNWSTNILALVLADELSSCQHLPNYFLYPIQVTTVHTKNATLAPLVLLTLTSTHGMATWEERANCVPPSFLRLKEQSITQLSDS